MSSSSSEDIIVPFTMSENLDVLSETSLVVTYVGTGSEVALTDVNAIIIPRASFDVNSSVCLIIIIMLETKTSLLRITPYFSV